MPLGSEIQRWRVAIQYLPGNRNRIFCSKLQIFVCPRDLKFNGGLLRLKIVLEIEIKCSPKNHVFFGMPLGSEVQRWLVAS